MSTTPIHIWGLNNSKPFLFCSAPLKSIERCNLRTWVDVCCGDVEYREICPECVQVLAVSQEEAKANNEFTLINLWEY